MLNKVLISWFPFDVTTKALLCPVKVNSNTIKRYNFVLYSFHFKIDLFGPFILTIVKF